MRNPISTAATSVADLAHVALAAFWPRSAVRQEIDRLRDEGHQLDTACEFAFSIAFPEAVDPEAMARVRAEGFVPDAAPAKGGFVTVRSSLQLESVALARTLRRLERAVESRGAFVAVIGPTQPAAYPMPSRAAALEYEERMAAA